jgi:hypothetical protein
MTEAHTQGTGSAWFDIAVLLASMFIVGWLTDLVHAGEDISPLFGMLLLAGNVAYTAGAILKRAPLQARLATQPPWGGRALLLFLVLGTMHLGVFALAAMLAVEALGVPDALAISLWVAAGMLPTTVTVIALVPARHGAERPSSAWRETGADAAIGFGTVVLLALWEGALVPSVAGKAHGSIALSAVLVALMTVPFAIFYLAPRILFLAEDFRKGGTWFRVVLVALPMAWRIVRG